MYSIDLPRYFQVQYALCYRGKEFINLFPIPAILTPRFNQFFAQIYKQIPQFAIAVQIAGNCNQCTPVGTEISIQFVKSSLQEHGFQAHTNKTIKIHWNLEIFTHGSHINTNCFISFSLSSRQRSSRRSSRNSLSISVS